MQERKTGFASRQQSLPVFEHYITYAKDGTPDVSGLFSEECYRNWVISRKRPPKNAPEAFRKAIIAHTCGSDGRLPFTPEVEKLVLQTLRKKECWKCFEKAMPKIGIRGAKVKGFWEKRDEEDAEAVLPEQQFKKRKVSREMDEIEILLSLESPSYGVKGNDYFDFDIPSDFFLSSYSPAIFDSTIITF